jgi:MSHA biogenesis protein MshN
MSLINDVLRDLERRRQAPAVDILRGVRAPLPPRGQRRWLWLLVLPLVPVLGWVVHRADVLVAPAASQALAVPEEPVAVPAHQPEPVATTVEALRPAVQLTGLSLSQAANRLRAVLSLNGPVSHRVERAADGQGVLLALEGAELPGMLPAPTGAESLLQGLDVRRDGERLLFNFSFAQPVRVQTAVEARGEGAAIVLEAVAAEPPKPAVAAKETPAKLEPAPAPAPSVEPSERIATGSFQKTPTQLSPAELAARAYAEGESHLRSGRSAAALAAWEQALVQDPSHRPARTAMAELLLNTGRVAEAEALLRRAHERWPADSGFAERYGRLLIAQGRDADAILVLEAGRPPLVGDGEYLALLAAVYQRLGRYAESAEAYGQVLNDHPQREVWWMGLGIALEGAGQAQPAAKAYRHALALPGLSRELRGYAEGRLRSLASRK